MIENLFYFMSFMGLIWEENGIDNWRYKPEHVGSDGRRGKGGDDGKDSGRRKRWKRMDMTGFEEDWVFKCGFEDKLGVCCFTFYFSIILYIFYFYFSSKN